MKDSYPFITEKYTNPIVSLGLVKSWLEMDIDGYEGKNELIQSMIDSAISSIETACNFELGVSLYEWNTDCRPCEFVDTFYVTNIESISYKGGDDPGEDGFTTIDPASYELVRVSKRRSKILWSEDFTLYPSRCRIKFRAGLPEGKVPDDVIRAIRAKIGEDFESGGDGVSEKRTLSDKLIAPYTIGYAG